MKNVIRLVLAAFLIASVGCGSEKEGKIEGTVMLDGKPMAGGTITFAHAAGGVKNSVVTVEIQPDGTYVAEHVPFGELCIGIIPPAKQVVDDNGQKQDVRPEVLAKKSKDELGRVQAAGNTEAVAQPVYAPGSAVSIPLILTDPFTSNLKVTLDQKEMKHDVAVASVSN